MRTELYTPLYYLLEVVGTLKAKAGTGAHTKRLKKYIYISGLNINFKMAEEHVEKGEIEATKEIMKKSRKFDLPLPLYHPIFYFLTKQ